VRPTGRSGCETTKQCHARREQRLKRGNREAGRAAEDKFTVLPSPSACILRILRRFRLRFSALMRNRNRTPSRWSISCCMARASSLRHPSRPFAFFVLGADGAPWRRAPPSRECRGSSGSLLLIDLAFAEVISGLTIASLSLGFLPMLTSITVTRFDTPPGRGQPYAWLA